MVINWCIRVALLVVWQRKAKDFSKLRNIWKISKLKNYYLVLSPPPEMKILSVLVKISWKKQKLNISRNALFQIKTRVCLKYFANDCSLRLDTDKLNIGNLETIPVDLSK